jgi:hypothetical protein
VLRPELDVVVAGEDVGVGLEDRVEDEGVCDEVIEARVELDKVRVVLNDYRMVQGVLVLYF